MSQEQIYQAILEAAQNDSLRGYDVALNEIESMLVELYEILEG